MSTATLEQPTPTTATAVEATATATEALTVKFRRNAKKEWVLFGPASLVQIGSVIVTKKDGKTTVEKVLGLGAIFDNDGVPYRYGYLTAKDEETASKPAQPSSAEGSFLPDDYDNLPIEDEF
jgi:hypothetical protein